MLSGVFWFLATVNVTLSVGFILWLSTRGRKKSRTPSEAARGQHQDIWLSTMTIWVVLLTPG